MPRPRHALSLVSLITLAAAGLAGRAAASPAAAETLARLPVREVTVFKDGHAFVVHSGSLPVSADGKVVIEGLPAPVLGTFWPFSADPRRKLKAVTASRRPVKAERTALTARELIAANPGQEVRIVDSNGTTFDGRIVAVPERSPREREASPAAPVSPEWPALSPTPAPGERSVVLLATEAGTAVIALDQVRTVTFRGEPRRGLAEDELRGLLTLDLEGAGGEAEIGMGYLQKGLRWIPAYKVTIDGQGGADVRLQATLVNELADLEDVTVSLVVGVPTFAFGDMLDPVALQAAMAQLGAYFDAAPGTRSALDNVLMNQMARPAEGPGRGAALSPATDLGPELAGQGRDEDLYVFTVHHVSLRKGERMVLPVSEHRLRYRDVYKLDLPAVPPAEVRASGGGPQGEAARLLAGPRVIHVLRLSNSSGQPMTTAPALITSGERILGQGAMTYAATGTEVDLPVTTAVDIRVQKQEIESGRTPNALSVRGTSYGRVDLAGTLTLSSTRAEAVELEVRREVVGHTGAVSAGGTAEMLSPFDEGALAWREPEAWRYYNWPGWWSEVNGTGRFRWKVRLEPGASVKLTYGWHYFWP